jgi:steroid delta-isomerase-like uncharacterized protein
MTSNTGTQSADFRVAHQAFIDRVLNDHDLDALDELVAEDFHEQNPPPGMGAGRQGLRDFLASMFAAFPDLRWDVKQSVAADGCVAMWSVWSGTHQGEFMGIPATGRAVAVEAWTLDILRDGLLVESRILMDAMGMLTQLGALPGPDAPAPG